MTLALAALNVILLLLFATYMGMLPGLDVLR